MSNPNFTPGPWFVVDGDIYRRPKESLYEYGGSVAGDRPLARALAGWVGKDEKGYPVKANAVLIAAAPDMYEALANMTGLVRDYLSHDNECDHSVGLCCCGEKRWIREAEAALRKARGE